MINPKDTTILVNISLMLATAVALMKPGVPKLNVFDKDATTPLRFILAVFVAITHLPWLTPLKIGTPAVAVFFFISGYGMVKSYLSKGDIYLEGLSWKYAVKLLGPYFVCAIPWMMRLFVGGIFSDNYDYNIQFILRGLYHGNMGVLLPHSWYPWALLFFGIVFMLAYKVNGRLIRQLCVFIGLAIYYYITRYILHFGGFWYVSTWAFLVGCSYAEYEENLISVITRLKWIYPISMLAFYMIFRFGIEKIPIFKGLPIISELSHVMIGIVVITALYVYKLPRWKWLIFAGGISYEYYLCHGEVHFVLSKLAITDPKLSTVLTLLVSIPIAFGVHTLWRMIRSKISVNA